MITQNKTKTYTSGEFSEVAALPENADRILELIGGEIVEKMPSFTPSRIAMLIGHYILQYVLQHGTGYVTGADGSYVISEFDTFNADVGYISKERLPEEPPREVPIPPDMAVEVKSPTDSIRGMRQRKNIWLLERACYGWFSPKNRQSKCTRQTKMSKPSVWMARLTVAKYYPASL